MQPGENSALLDHSEACAAQLASICAHFGFHGWLVNIEARLPGAHGDVARLAAFLASLRRKCAAVNGGRSRVLVYDSVSAGGAADCWACALPGAHPRTGEASANPALLAAANGLLLDYHWAPSSLAATRAAADAMTAGTTAGATTGATAQATSEGAGRRCDVYVGVDVFGRGTCHGAGFGAAAAVGQVAAAGLSLGVFAPGWVLEAGPGGHLFGDGHPAGQEQAEASEAEAAALDDDFWRQLDTGRVKPPP